MAIELPAETTKKSIASIRRYFKEELDLEIGDLKAQLVLEFFIKEIGASIYNTAITDAQAFLRDRVADLEGALFQPEFAHWPKSSRRS
jgi:uncharacterized protein (DUF2164 family)